MEATEGRTAVDPVVDTVDPVADTVDTVADTGVVVDRAGPPVMAASARVDTMDNLKRSKIQKSMIYGICDLYTIGMV